MIIDLFTHYFSNGQDSQMRITQNMIKNGLGHLGLLKLQSNNKNLKIKIVIIKVTLLI